MSNFERDYEEFCDDIADYITRHRECQEMMEQLKRNRMKMIAFTDKAFRIWKNDRSRLGWYIQNQRLRLKGETGRKG